MLKLQHGEARVVLRVSFGPETMKEEIDALVSALKAHRDTRFPML